jgi:hypothetical protein
MRRTFVFTSPTETREIVLEVRTEQVGGEWRARTNVTGFPGEVFPDQRGADEFDVVLAACRFADFQLRRLARIYGGAIMLDGSADLALIVKPLTGEDPAP